MNITGSRTTPAFLVCFLSLLVLLSLTADSYSVGPHMKFFLFLLMNCALAGTILLSLPAGLDLRQFVGMMYLVLVGVAHLWLGILGLGRSGEWASVLLWQFSPVMPLATLGHVLHVCVIRHPCTRNDLWYTYSGADEVTIVSAIIILISLAGIAAAIAVAGGKKLGGYMWLCFVSASALAACWMVIANATIVQEGESLYRDPWGPSVLWSLFWPASCAASYWAARKRAEL
jgi:hypothetical protein